MPKERYKEGTGDTTGLRFRKIPSRFPQDSLEIPRDTGNGREQDETKAMAGTHEPSRSTTSQK